MKKFPRSVLAVFSAFVLASVYFISSTDLAHLRSTVLEDGTIIEDGVMEVTDVTPTCGNFACEAHIGENKATCSQDCGAVICGDNICEYDENQNTCTPDCGGAIVMCSNGGTPPDCVDPGSSVYVSPDILAEPQTPTVIQSPLSQDTTPTTDLTTQNTPIVPAPTIAPLPPGSPSAEPQTLNAAPTELTFAEIQSRFGVSEAEIWEEARIAFGVVESRSALYVGPYCSRPVPANRPDITRGDLPGVQITANFSNMWGGAITTECLPCSNGSYRQALCRMCPEGQAYSKWGCLGSGLFCPPGQDYTGSGCRKSPERCGDAVTQKPKEECDDGNTNNNDACLGGLGHPLACKNAKCGDGYIWTGHEYCDPKDGKTEPGKPDCDPTTCQKSICGDGTVQANRGEECDLGSFNEDFGPCTTQCKKNVCGDGARNVFAEDCDDGNKNNEDGCSSTCKVEKCGDAIVQKKLKEECDDGEYQNSDVNRCSAQCKLNICGDGKKFLGKEECDDGNTNNNDGCTSTCKEEKCGDKVVQTNEECDDANQVATDACINECKNAKCGDGIVWKGKEYCDIGLDFGPSAIIPPLDCNPTTCQKRVCGDGAVDPGEECDDKNKNDNDGCSSMCKIEKCGDGKVQGKLGEECDDGNDKPGDGCNQCKRESCSDTNKIQCSCDDAYTKKKIDEALNLLMQKEPDRSAILQKIDELPKDCLEPYLCKQPVEPMLSCGMPVKQDVQIGNVQMLLYARDLLKPAGIDALYRSKKELFNGGPIDVNLDAEKLKTRDALIGYGGSIDKLKKIQKECPMMEKFINTWGVYDFDPKSPKRIKMVQMSLFLSGHYSGQIDGQLISTNESMKTRFKWSGDRFGFPYLQGYDYEIGALATIFGLNPNGSIDTDDNGLGNGFMNPANVDYNTRDPNLRGASLPLPVLVHELCPDIKTDIANHFRGSDEKMKSDIQKAEQRARDKIVQINSNKTSSLKTKSSQISQINSSLIQEKSQIQIKNTKNKDCQAMMAAVKYWDPHTSEVTTQVILQNCLNYLDTNNASTCKQRLRAATIHIKVSDQVIPVPVKLVDIGPRRSIWDRERRPTIDLTYGANKELMSLIDESPKGKIYDICFYID